MSSEPVGGGILGGWSGGGMLGGIVGSGLGGGNCTELAERSISGWSDVGAVGWLGGSLGSWLGGSPGGWLGGWLSGRLGAGDLTESAERSMSRRFAEGGMFGGEAINGLASDRSLARP